MRGFSLILTALLCESGSVLIFLSNGGMPTALAIAFLFHLAGSILLALAMPAALPANRMGGKEVGLVFFSFTFFIPCFGALGMLLVLLHFRFARKKGWRPEFFSIPQLPFAAIEGVRPVRMGEGGAWSRLREESVSRQVKLEAIMAAGAASGHNASRLLQMATGDIDDEIRLVAFNFFEKREKKINVSINKLLSDLKDADEDVEKGDICGKLAFAYWEFVYNELARAELKDFYLNQAMSHVHYAEKLSGENHRISLLKGRIQLRMGNVDEAVIAVNRALELGASPDKVVPFKAEALYLRRDFDALKNLLSDYAYLRHKPGIGAIVSFWIGA